MHIMRNYISNKINDLGFYVAMLIIICTIFRPFIPRMAADLWRVACLWLVAFALKLITFCTDFGFFRGAGGKKFTRRRRDVITHTHKIRKIESANASANTPTESHP